MRQQQCAIKPILKLNFVAAFAASALLFTPAALAVVSGQSLDYFNYRETKLDSETNNGFDDYGPADWRQIECAEADACVSNVADDTPSLLQLGVKNLIHMYFLLLHLFVFLFY